VEGLLYAGLFYFGYLFFFSANEVGVSYSFFIFLTLALWVSPHWRVTFWLQPQKVTKKGRPISFALRVPEFGRIAYAPALMRRPGAQG